MNSSGVITSKILGVVITPRILEGPITPKILGGGVNNPNNPPYLHHWQLTHK